MKISINIELNNGFVARHIVNSATLIDGSPEEIFDIGLNDMWDTLHYSIDKIDDHFDLDGPTAEAIKRIKELLCNRPPAPVFSNLNTRKSP